MNNYHHGALVDEHAVGTFQFYADSISSADLRISELGLIMWQASNDQVYRAYDLRTGKAVQA